jgi:predicted DNA-binding transcriptional regulator YafY
MTYDLFYGWRILVRGNQVTRQWRLVRLLSATTRGKSIPDLQRELEVTSRTVRRDLEALEHAGFPLISEPRHGEVLWRFIDGYQPESPIALTTDELMALYFSRQLLEPLHGTPMYEGIQSALRKIGAVVSLRMPSLRGSLESGISVSSFGRKDYRKAGQVFTKLMHGMRNHFTLELEYKAPRKEQAGRYRLDPYKLWYQDHGLYVVGWDHDHADFRVFAVERIVAVKATNQRFEPREDFNFHALKSTAFRFVWGEPKRVRIRFAADQAVYATERTWHVSQKVFREHDGTAILEFKVADLKEVKRWLIGWGAGAEVLEPVELADEVLGECRSVVSRYNSKSKANAAT